ncbi:ATPase [Pelosinus sp. sgz500959]|uniref:ATPase n=1 Tax=Pelosinus sp. sgz500959 TaxID=3242472 RepID=UPI00366FEF89
MTIDGILDELESLLTDGSRLPFTNKRILEEDDVIRLLDELREKFPDEVAEAAQIVAERQRILEKAQEEARKIVEQAKMYAIKLTDENIIAKQAQEQSNEIVILANKEAADLRNDAISYADSVFKHLEGQIEKTLEVVRQGHNELIQSRRNEKNLEAARHGHNELNQSR